MPQDPRERAALMALFAFFATAAFALIMMTALAGCSAFSRPSFVPDDIPQVTPPTVATWTAPAPITDAHGCSEQDWKAAYSYGSYAESARENEHSVATLELQDREEHLAKLKALDDRKDLDAKVERHFLEEGDDNISASAARDQARWDRSMAATDLARISPKCREWLEKDGR